MGRSFCHSWNHRTFVDFVCEKIFFKLLSAVCLVICAIAALRFAFGYMQIIHTYKQGNYKSIEGYVENFVPASSGGEDMEQESFDIKGVHFSYGDRFIKKYCKNRKTKILRFRI